MSDKVEFPSAIHMVRVINDNIVNNLLVKRTAYVQAGSLYHRAYAIVYETGETELIRNVLAPDESTSAQAGVRIISSNG